MNSAQKPVIDLVGNHYPSPVRDVTWLNGQSVRLAKWMHALEQVTDWHLVKWPHQLTT